MSPFVHRWLARLLALLYVLGLWLAVFYVIVPLFDQLAPTWRELRRWPIFSAILWVLPVAFAVGVGVYTCLLAGRGTANAVRRWWGEKP